MKEDNYVKKLDNGIFVIDLGYREREPIALVQRVSGKYMEYVIAFSYEIKDNKMNWGYGYYYDKDFEKAKSDFEKVIVGGNLYKTFEKKESKKRNERGR